MADKLQLGDFVFELDDLPEEIPLGGEQMMAVTKYPGGFKEVQAFGAQDRNPSWSAVFNYSNALQKVRAVDAMYRSGNVYPLQIGPLATRYVIVKKFEWKYRSAIEVSYDIELELVPQQGSILDPNTASPSTGSGGIVSNSTISPDSSAASQQPYIVKDGDTLWSIAQQFYGDGSQYRKIATANNIVNPDQIISGQQLVIT